MRRHNLCSQLLYDAQRVERSCFLFDEAGNGRMLELWEGLESNSTYQDEVIPIEQTALYETSPLLPVCPKLFVDACVLL